MFKNLAQDTLNPSMSRKSIKCGVEIPNINEELSKYFLHTFELYQQLFTIIKNQNSFYSRPEPLRHPLIFYFGHTATFYINKLIDCGMLKKHINDVYEHMFAVGVDENDWDDMEESHYNWPRLEEVKNYRAQVKKVILQLISQNQEKQINSKSKLWGLMMGIDHQRIHMQTSAVIMRRLKADQVQSPDWVKQCPFKRDDPKKVPLNTMKTVPKTEFIINNLMDKAEYYGWDCNFGIRKIKINEFKASRMLVSNAQFLEFYLQNGYQNEKYWTAQGWTWATKNNISKPVFWVLSEGDKQDMKNYKLKTLTQEISMPWDWPVQVNNHESRAFCNWKSEKTGKKLRLPTQDQYLALRSILKTDSETWEYQSVGNINLQFWLSPCPVDTFQIEGFYDIVGNVLQHTGTPLFPYQKFQIHPLYQDFTTPCLDNRHDVLRGGCFISTGNSAAVEYRPGFRRHFYLFAGFRYVESDNPTEIAQQEISQSDESLKHALKLHFVDKESYIKQVNAYVHKNITSEDKKSLIVGCSVGRLPLEMAGIFIQSYGIDYTARFFQMATRLLQKGSLSYQGINIKLQDLKITQKDMNRVRLYQMNPINVDKNKINNIDWAIIDGFNLRRGTITNVVKSCFALFKQPGQQSPVKTNALIICPKQGTQGSDIQEKLQSLLSPKYSIKLVSSFNVENICGQQVQQGTVYHLQVTQNPKKN